MFCELKMSRFLQTKNNVRVVLYCCFHLKKSAIEIRILLTKVCGEYATSFSARDRSFRCFKYSHFDMDHKDWHGQPKIFADIELEAFVETDQCQTLNDLEMFKK